MYSPYNQLILVWQAVKYSTLLDILETTKDIFGSVTNVGGDIYLSKVTEVTFCLNFLLKAWDVKTTQLHILDVFIHNKTRWWKNCGISLVIHKVTRWYPRGIQQLVSTYELQTNSNSKYQDLPKFSFPQGGGYSRPTFLKYLSEGTQGILNQKFWQLECVVHHR